MSFVRPHVPSVSSNNETRLSRPSIRSCVTPFVGRLSDVLSFLRLLSDIHHISQVHRTFRRPSFFCLFVIAFAVHILGRPFLSQSIRVVTDAYLPVDSYIFAFVYSSIDLSDYFRLFD